MKRRFGLVSAAALVVANMIGVGVFTTSGFALANLGRPEPVLLAWLVGGLLALCGAVSYGALARHIPESGGEYTLLSRTVHPLAGFLAGWISLLVGKEICQRIIHHSAFGERSRRKVAEPSTRMYDELTGIYEKHKRATA